MTKLVKLFSEILKVPESNILDDTSPENTPQWDSLNSMKLVVAIEETYEIRLTTKEIMKMNTFAIVKNVLKQKKVDEM
jgi:acyl carrier protein